MFKREMPIQTDGARLRGSAMRQTDSYWTDRWGTQHGLYGDDTETLDYA